MCQENNLYCINKITDITQLKASGIDKNVCATLTTSKINKYKYKIKLHRKIKKCKFFRFLTKKVLALFLVV